MALMATPGTLPGTQEMAKADPCADIFCIKIQITDCVVILNVRGHLGHFSGTWDYAIPSDSATENKRKPTGYKL
jgi:hypothetical protein